MTWIKIKYLLLDKIVEGKEKIIFFFLRGKICFEKTYNLKIYFIKLPTFTLI